MPSWRQAAADEKPTAIRPTAKRAEVAARKEAGLSQESPVVMSWRQPGEAAKAKSGPRAEASSRQAGGGRLCSLTATLDDVSTKLTPDASETAMHGGGAQPTPVDARSPAHPAPRPTSSDGQWARGQEGALTGGQQGRPRGAVRGVGGGGRVVPPRVSSPSPSTSSRSSSASLASTGISTSTSTSMATWGLRAQRRERQLWHTSMTRLTALTPPPTTTHDNPNPQVWSAEALCSVEGVLLKVLGELSTLCLPVPLVSKEEGGQLLALLCCHSLPLLQHYSPQQAQPLTHALVQWMPLLLQRQPPALQPTHREAVLRCLLVMVERGLGSSDSDPSPCQAPLALALLTQVLCVECVGGGANNRGVDEGLLASLYATALLAAQPCSRLVLVLGQDACPPPCPWAQSSAALGLLHTLLSQSNTHSQSLSPSAVGGEVGALLLDVLHCLAPLHQASLLHPQRHDRSAWPAHVCMCLLHALRGLHCLLLRLPPTPSASSSSAPLHNPTQAGTLLLAINQVLQPLVVCRAGTGTQGSYDYDYPGTSDLAPSRRTPPPSPKRTPPLTQQSPPQCEEGVEVVWSSLRLCALQVVATLSQRAPHSVRGHWMLLLPLHMHPPRPNKPTKPVLLRGPGVAPLLLVLLECGDVASAEGAASAILHLLTALPLHHWLEAAAMGLRAKPVRGNKDKDKGVGVGVVGPFLGDRVVAMVTALHEALAAALHYNTTTSTSTSTSLSQRGGLCHCADLAKVLATLLSAVPYNNRSLKAQGEGEGCVSAWEGVLQSLAQHALSVLTHAQDTLFNDSLETGSRHGAAQLLSLSLSTITTGPSPPPLPLPPTAHPVTVLLLHSSISSSISTSRPRPPFVPTVLTAARGQGPTSGSGSGVQCEALVLLARLGRHHGGLLLHPPPSMPMGMEGVGQTLLSSFQHVEQNVRLHALKALEDLLTWATSTSTSTSRDTQSTQATGLLQLLLRPLFRGCSDPYHGVRSLSCSCLALLLTLHPLAQCININTTTSHDDTQRRADTTQLLCLVVELATSDPTSGVVAAAVRVVGLVLGQDKGLEALEQVGLLTQACHTLVHAARHDKVAVRAQGVWALGNLPCPSLTLTHTQASGSGSGSGSVGVRLCDSVEEGVLVAMAKAALAALTPPHTTPRVKASAVRAVGVAAALLQGTSATAVQDECVCALSECVRAEGTHDQAALKCQWNACHALVSLLCPGGALAARLVSPLPSAAAAPVWASSLFLALASAMDSPNNNSTSVGVGPVPSTPSGSGSGSGSAQADHKVRAYACQALAASPTRHVYGHAFGHVLLAAVQALRESLFCPEVSLLLLHLLSLAQEGEGEDSECLADAAVMRGEGGLLLYQWLALLRQSRPQEVRAMAGKVEAALVYQAMHHQEGEQDDKAAQDDALERFRFLIAALDRQRHQQQAEGTEEEEEL